MAEQSPQPFKQQVPDTSDTYERAHPEHEVGQGKMDINTKATPTPEEDKMPTSVSQAQDGSKQLNAQTSATRPEVPTKTVSDNEPLGWEPDKKK